MYKRFIVAGIIFLGIAVPVFAAHADVSVNEVAWMGTVNSQYEEWLELYNNGTNDVSLAGWKIVKDDGAITMATLSKTISAGKYLLVCRTTASVPKPLTSSCDENVPFAGSGLGNSGEHLQLKDDQGTIVDDLPFANGWPAGDTTTKQSMQRTSAGTWVTGISTPGAVNVSSPADQGGTSGQTDNPTTQPSAGGTSGDDTNGTPPGTIEAVTQTSDSGTDSPPVVVSSSKLAQSMQSNEKVVPFKPDPTYTARMILPDFDTAGVAVPISATVKQNGRRDMVSGKFEWSMGDGVQYVLEGNAPVEHIFPYPGTYNIVLNYYSSSLKTDPDSVHRKTITIIPAAISITGVTDDKGIILKNSSTNEIDLGGWMLTTNGKSFTFPRYTIISKNQSLSLSSKTLGFDQVPGTQSILANPSNLPISTYPTPQ